MMMNKKILICDDDQDILQVTSIILQQNGFQVEQLSHLAQLFHKVKEFNPDLILMDLRMPGIGGAEATEQLKVGEETKSIPVILFSANANMEQISLKIGADDFLPKPFDLNELVHKVKHHLNKVEF